MTWNDLIERLNTIPEERREEKAIACDPEYGIEFEIDAIIRADGELQTVDPALDDKDMPFILTP